MVFRGSIARRLTWLSTLRRGGRPPTTQDSLPAAGPALPDGIITRRIPYERFLAQGCPPFLGYMAQGQTEFLVSTVPGRVAPRDCSPGAPADPDLRIITPPLSQSLDPPFERVDRWD